MVTQRDRRGFTLIELLIVTVVIVSLMGIVFRLTGLAGSSSAREKTVSRMQRLENCLSGYYAVFGSYPPVPLQGVSRDIDRKSLWNGIQSTESEKRPVKDSWGKIRAACLAQPVRARFPAPEKHGSMSSGDYAENYQKSVQDAYADEIYTANEKKQIDEWLNASLVDFSKTPGALSGKENKTSFNELPLFRFGLMSFLLPRYRFMLDCTKKNGRYNSSGFKPFTFKQWTDNNPLPAHMNTGISYESWDEFCKKTFGEDQDWQIDLIPSQAACARWLPNLVPTADDPHVVHGLKINVFGMDIGDGEVFPSIQGAGNHVVYSKDGYKEGTISSGYNLFFITMQDGWSSDFYYYSPAPYQSYVLWSAGRNGYTFPPWIDVTQLDSADYKTAMEWMSDDIKFMSTGK